MVPHDIKGLKKLMGGNKKFEARLDELFEKDQFDMANEPDFAYGYLYNFIPGKEYKASEKIHELIATYYKNAPDGIPGNDDTGTMSAWVIYSMMGIYPITPAEPVYTFVVPTFDKIILHLDDNHYENAELIIENHSTSKENLKIEVDGEIFTNSFFDLSKNNLFKKINFL